MISLSVSVAARAIGRCADRSGFVGKEAAAAWGRLPDIANAGKPWNGDLLPVISFFSRYMRLKSAEGVGSDVWLQIDKVVAFERIVGRSLRIQVCAEMHRTGFCHRR